MAVLHEFKVNYAILGITAYQALQPYPFNTKILMAFLMFGLSTTSHFVYIFHQANTFTEYIECITTTSGSFIISICFATMVFKMTTLFGFITKLERIIEIRSKKSSISKVLFRKSLKQIEKLHKIVTFVSVKIALQCLMLPKFIGSFIAYFTTDFGSDSLVLPIPMSFPFDTKTPIGYLGAVALQYTQLSYEFFLLANLITFAIGSFLYVMSGSEDIRGVLNLMSVSARSKKRRLRTIKKYNEFVEEMSLAKQATHMFSDIFQPIFMALFTWSLVALSGGMLMVQLSHQETNSMALLLTIIDACIAFGTLLISCELSQRVENAFREIVEDMDQLDWYLLPIELKRTLPLVIEMVQEPVTLECFGSITCNRDVFKRIVKSAFSYYTMLRNLI